MSRAQQGDVDSTATAENSTYNANATTAFGDASKDIGSYADAVGAFKAANPYTPGGTVQTADNQQTADTAAGLAQSTGQALQGASVRGGQNAGAPIAATEQMEEANERALTGQEAANTKDIAAANTGYQGAVVGDTANIANMQDTVAQQQAAAAQGALGTEEAAAQTPSFLDALGSGLTGSIGTLGAAGIGKIPCWIAAELWGGWTDPRTVQVRGWLFGEFSRSWYGALLCRAYLRWGECMAETIKTRPGLRRCFQWIFDRALVAAKRWQEVKHG